MLKVRTRKVEMIGTETERKMVGVTVKAADTGTVARMIVTQGVLNAKIEVEDIID